MCHKFVREKKVLHGKLKSISLRRQALLLQNRRSRKVLEVSIRPMMKPKRDSMNNKVLCCHIFFAQPPRRRKSKGRRISAGTSGPNSLNGIWCGSAWVYKLPSVPDIRRVVRVRSLNNGDTVNYTWNNFALLFDSGGMWVCVCAATARVVCFIE